MKLRLSVIVPVIAIVLSVFWPAGSNLVVRLLVIAAAAMTLAAVRSGVVEAIPEVSAASPFQPQANRRRATEQPADLAWLSEHLADCRAATQRTGGTGQRGDRLSAPVIERVRLLANGRLATNHRLKLEFPGDHERIRALVTPMLWTAIGPVRRNEQGALLMPSLPLDALPVLLDELEQL